MTSEQISDALLRIKNIDELFDGATGWGSWMVMAANEREALVNKLQANGVKIEHKWLARTADGGHTS
jgi:hypothetical protein